MKYTIGHFFKTDITEYQYKLINQRHRIIEVPWHLTPLLQFQDGSYYNDQVQVTPGAQGEFSRN